jgi:hypothetical protein
LTVICQNSFLKLSPIVSGKDKWITKIELHANSLQNFNAAGECGANTISESARRDTKINIIRFIAGRRATAAAALSGGIIFLVIFNFSAYSLKVGFAPLNSQQSAQVRLGDCVSRMA